MLSVIFTDRKRSYGKVMLSQVSVCPQEGEGGCLPPGGGVCIKVDIPQDTVNRQAARILLECALVNFMFW